MTKVMIWTLAAVAAFGVQAHFFYSVGWNYGHAAGIHWSRVQIYGDRR